MMVALWTDLLKKRFFRRVLLAELILMLICAAGLFGKNTVYEYGTEDMTVRFGEYSEEAGGIYADETAGHSGNMVDFEGITLPRGVYRVCLQYQTDEDFRGMCTVSDGTLGYRSLRTNGQHLYAGLKQTDFDMWLLKGTSGLIVHASYNGQGSIMISGLTIYETNALNRIMVFVTVLLSILMNACLLLREYDKRYGFSREQKNVGFGLILLILISALPVLPDYLPGAADMTFHLWRIEGLKEGLLTGQFPVRISAEWQYGYGYAAPIFYGETFLLIPALLRMIGFTITTSYRWYLILINASTILIAYRCFGKILKSRYLGLFGSMLYGISVYRIHKTYLRGTLGEALAMMLLPLLVYGFYRVFTQDIREKGYARNWIPLTIGFAGILQSHLLTGEMAGAFTILLCIVMWKKVFRWPTFKVLAKTVIYALLISAWFVIPFADYTLTGDFRIQHASGRRIQDRGLYLGHLLFTFFRTGENVHYAETGMYLTDATGLGIALVTVFGIWLFMAFFGHTARMSRRDRRLGNLLASFSGISMLLSLSAFPWDRIQALSPITATLVSSLEFPDRLLTIANLCLPLLAGLEGKYLLEKKQFLLNLSYFGGVGVLILLSSVYLMNDTMYRMDFTRIYNEAGMGFGYVSSGEYLPYGTDTDLITFGDPFGEGIEVRNWSRRGLNLKISCANIIIGEGELKLPLLYYKGYRAGISGTDKELDIYAGENFAATVRIPEDFEGEISVEFVPPWYWRAGELITLISVAVFAIDGVRRKREKVRNVRTAEKMC